MRAYVLLILFIGSYYKVAAQSATFDLPDSLKSKTNTIVLNDETVFTIINSQKTTTSKISDVIILNKYATSRSEIVLYYDKFTTITKALVEEIDEKNKVTNKFNLKDFKDYSATGNDVATDGRYKVLTLISRSYPFRFRLSYEIEKNHTFSYPRWSPQKGEGEFIVKSSLKVINKSKASFRYQNINISDPEINSTDAEKIYLWEVSNVLPYKYESYNYYKENYAPIVRLAPNEFSMDGYPGDLSSWSSFALWINKLNEGKNTLTSDQLKEIKSLIKESDTNIEKIRKVYNYMQNRTRYVSIQLGIGGLQPFDASFVHEKSYGDCKALSFYTKSLLEAIGITSYYTLIEAGRHPDELNEAFTYDPFNHVILTVPLEKDTVWLECTSQTNPFGYLGTFTSDRKALLIDQNGGKLISTTSYTENDNIQITTAKVNLDKKGSAYASIERSYMGIEVENDGFQYMLLKTKDDQDKWFYDELSWGDFKVSDYKLKEISDDFVPSAGFTIDLEINQLAKNSVNRLFLKPAHFTDISYMTLKELTRKKDLYIRYPYSQIDTIYYNFPDAYHVEKSLEDVEINNKYGSFSRKIEVNENGIKYIRRFVIKKGKYSPEEYSKFKEFIRDVQKFDRQQLVMVGST